MIILKKKRKPKSLRVGILKQNLNMKKIFILLTIFAFFQANVIGQLSDRQNNPTTFKIGTRPVAGNMGLYIGGTIQNIQKSVDDFADVDLDPFKLTMEDFNEDASNSRIPAVLLKFYKTDNMVYRIGILSKTQKAVIKGSLNQDVMGFSGDAEFSRRKSEFIILPGLEKHFAPLNILDVYVGADLPLGYVRSLYSDQISSSTASSGTEQKRFSFTYGLGAFIGVQAFIADLPFSVGMEFLYQGRGYLGNKIKHTDKLGTTTQTYYTVAGDDGSFGSYDDLKSRKFTAYNNVNVFISYFFNR